VCSRVYFCPDWLSLALLKVCDLLSVGQLGAFNGITICLCYCHGLRLKLQREAKKNDATKPHGAKCSFILRVRDVGTRLVANGVG